MASVFPPVEDLSEDSNEEKAGNSGSLFNTSYLYVQGFLGTVYISRIGQVDVSTIDCFGTLHHYDTSCAHQVGMEDSLSLKRLTLK